MEKSGAAAALTVSATVVVRVSEPPVPVTVSVNDPVAVPAGVETVRVEGVGGVTEPGFSVQVAPVGHPVTVRATLLLNPFSAVTVMVEVPDGPPWASVNDVGLLDIEKSGAGGVPQVLNLNDPKKELQLKLPFACWYWLVYQKVQSSAGSIRMAL